MNALMTPIATGSAGSATHPGASRRKQLLIVSELFHPSVGGMEVRYLDLGRVFIENDWQVDVVTIGSDSNLPERESIDGISVQRLVRTDSYKRPNSKLRRSPTAILEFSWKVRAHLKKNHYDVVIFNIWPLLPQLFAAIPAGTVAMVDWCEHRSTGLWPVLNRILSRATTKHISVSDHVKSTLMESYGIRDIACIPSGLFLRNFHSSSAKSGVLFFGRLAAHKRPEEAIRAVIRARELGFTEHLTVAGDGPEAADLRERYGHLDFIRIIGRVSNEAKYKLFAEHRIHLLPSIREGFPITVAEAMASGMPTITTKHPDNGTVAVVRQYRCGLVVEPGPESIAQAICRLAADGIEWRALSEQGLAGSAELDWEKVFRKLLTHAGLVSLPDAEFELIGSRPFASLVVQGEGR